jgi:prepilin-type N-terminal cleavage/methylation domain-containing protein
MKNKSFTLIELLVVIVIIGILAGVIMISTSSSIQKANIARGEVFSQSIKNNMFTNLIAEWTFDNILGVTVNAAIPAGTVILDDQGISNGTTYGTDKIYLKDGSDCVIRKCIYLNGTTGTITVPNNLDLQPIFGSENFTLETWVKPERWYNYEGLINKSSSGYYSASNGGLFVDFSGIHFLIGTGLDSSDVQILNNKPVLNEWYHVVGTVGLNNGSVRMKMYVNGSLVDNKPLTYNPDANTHNLCIGGFYEGVRGLKGYVDEVRIYNSILSQSQVQNNYIAGLNSMLANGNISKQEYNERINALAYDN